MRVNGSGDVLSQRALNRALLDRQLLRNRSSRGTLDVIEHLVGLQAQAPNTPYIGLWSRIHDFRHETLSSLITERQVVRIALMRGTIHLVTAEDCLTLRPAMQPAVRRGFDGNQGKRLQEVDLEAVTSAGRALVIEKPLTFHDMGKRLAEQWPDNSPGDLAMAVRTLLPLVQVPPRGVWGASGAAAHTTAEAWLGRQLNAKPSVDEIVLRYLGAFGPATVQDVQTWSGLKGLGEVVQKLKPGLRTFRDEKNRELYDLHEAPRPDADTPAPPRFTPEYDNLLLSHADRTRVLSEGHRRRIFTVNGTTLGTVLVDGFVRAIWKVVRESGRATLLIELLDALPKGDRPAVVEEGGRLLDFIAPDADKRDVRFGSLPEPSSRAPRLG